MAGTTIGNLLMQLNVEGGNEAQNVFINLGNVINRTGDSIKKSLKTKISDSLVNLGSGMQKFGKNIQSIGTSLTNNLSKPLLGIAVDIVKTTMTFDMQMSRVRAVTSATGKDFTTLRKLAIDMGSKTTKTATEAAEAMEYMGLAGWDVTKIQKGLEPVLRASEAGMMDLGLTSDLVTDSMSALGIGVNDLTRYLNIAANAQNMSNQSMQQFLEAMVIAGGTFKRLKTPLEEAGALLGILAERGYKGKRAGNALISILNNLTLKSGQSGKAMKELGIETYDANGKFRGISVILKDLNAKFATMTDKQRDTYIQMLGGKTRTKELDAMLNGAKTTLDGFTKRLYNSDGALSKMAKTMQDNFGGQVIKLKSILEGIAISFGDLLTPMLRLVTEQLQKAAEWFYKLSTPTKTVILIVGAVVAAIGPLVTIFGLLVAGVGAVIAGFGAIVGAISSISVPIVLVVGAIGALIASFVAIMLSSADVRSKIVNAFNNIVKAVQGAVGFIKKHMDDIKNAFIGLFDALTTGDTTTFTEAMKNMVPKELHGKIDAIALVLQDFWLIITKVKDAIVGFVEGAIKVMTPVINELIATFKGLDLNTIVLSFNQLKDSTGPLLTILGGLAALIGGLLIGAFNGIINAIDNLVAGVLNVVGVVTSVLGILWGLLTGNMDMVEEHWNLMWANIQGVLGNAIQIIIDLVGGFINGIVTFFKSLYDTLVGNSIIPDMVNAIVEWFNNLVSFVTGIVQGFVNIVITLFNAMKTGATTVFNAMKAVITTVINVIKTVITTGFNAAKTIVTTVINAIKNVVTTGFNAAKSIITSVISTIKSVISSGFNTAKSIITGVVNGIRSVVSSVFNSIKSKISSAVNSAKSILSGAFNAMRSTVNSVVNTISSKVNSMKSKISSAVSGAVSTIKSAASRMYSAGANLVGNLINGVVSKIGQFKAKISELANTAKQFLGFSSPTEKGPGRTADKWIPNLIGMMSKQLNNGVSEFSKGGSKLASAIQQSTTSTMSNSILSNTNRASNITASPANVTFKIDASHMDVDQLGRMLVSKFRSYGIRSQTE